MKKRICVAGLLALIANPAYGAVWDSAYNQVVTPAVGD